MSLIFAKSAEHRHSSDVRVLTVKQGLPWTHKLTISFYRMPWANYDRANVAIRDIVIPIIVNTYASVFLGYEYTGHYTLRWDDWAFDVFYREKGTPAITAVQLAAILGAIAGIIIGAGIICLAIAWYRREERIEKTTLKKSELLEKGLITAEQYDELIKAEKEEPAPWEKAVTYGLIGLIVIGALLVLPKVIPKRKEVY